MKKIEKIKTKAKIEEFRSWVNNVKSYTEEQKNVMLRKVRRARKSMRIKNYISYSQYQAFNSGQYEKIYLRGIKLNNKGLELGKIFAEAMESDEIRDDEIALIKLELPTPKHREKEFRVDWEGNTNAWKFRWF